MADNTTLNAGAGGDTIASDDIAGVKHQRVKVEWGSDGTATEVQDTVAGCMPIKLRAQHTVTDLSTTPLANTAVYTTAAFNTEDNGFGFTFIFIADQSASLELIESHDNVTYYISDTAAYPGASYVFNEMHVAHAKYFKVRVTNNSGSAMTAMTLQCIQRMDGMPWKIKLDANGNAVTQGLDAPWLFEGQKGNNAGAPESNMVPVVGHIVQSATPTYTSGFAALPTLNTSGDQRVTLDGESVAVTGTFWQATQPVSGTFWQATQPVSGPLTDTQLRATAVPVSGTFFQATQPVSIAATVATSEVAPTTVAHAQVTVTTAGTRVQFATNTAKSITVKALAANTGIIYVGGSGVTAANGFPLAAGDTVSLDISNTNVVWIDASVSTEKANWIANN